VIFAFHIWDIGEDFRQSMNRMHFSGVLCWVYQSQATEPQQSACKQWWELLPREEHAGKQ